MSETRVEVTHGEFDPREYKKVDKQGWAKKRRPDWMATTGKIRFTRERVVPSQERELEPPKREESPENVEEKMRNIDIKQLMEGEKEPARRMMRGRLREGI